MTSGTNATPVVTATPSAARTAPSAVSVGAFVGALGGVMVGAAVCTLLFPQMGVDSNPQLVRMFHELPPVD